MTYSMNAVQDPSHARGDMPSVGAASDYRIKRIGARPLIFAGSELAMAMSFTPELPYWYEINIYRTAQQSFVLAIRLFFQSEAEHDTVQAWEFETLGEVFDAIESYDAGADVRAQFPESMAAAAPAELAASAMELAARVKAARHHYAGLVGELFEEMDRMAAMG